MFENYVLFENKWEIDLNSIKFMGCSTKDWISTIWKFWTGLKYAISTLLRAWVKIEVFSWKTRVEFTTQKKMIGWKEFDQILMNWEETWLTTALGREWKLWQGFREFYANCLDENWKRINWLYKRQGKEWMTRVFIEATKEIKATFDYFKFNGWVEVSAWNFYTKKKSISPVKIFKEWFLVYEGDQGEQSLYDYRIDSTWINEARLVENTWVAFSDVGKIIAKMDFYNVNQVLEAWDYKLVSSWDSLWEGWNQAQQSRGWEIITLSTSLNEQLKLLRTKKDDTYKYYHGFHWDTVSLIIVEPLGEFDISWEWFKAFSSNFVRNEQKKFDFDLNKNEIYINSRFLDERNRIMLIVQELIENNRKERSQFIIELLERIYPKQ